MVQQDKIHDLRDISPRGIEKFTQQVIRARRLPFASPIRASDNDPVLQAEINHGRWIVQCPSCAGAELVDPADLRFFCLSCYNRAHGGRWLRVTLPAEKPEIEAVLLLRRPQNQHWQPGETVAKLKAKNKEAGKPLG